MSEAKRRILLIDDEPTMVKTVGKRLEVSGYEVLIAMDALEALTKARSENPDIIVLDMNLPTMNGFEICRALKQDSSINQIPIIIFTSQAAEMGFDEQWCHDVGASAYVAKHEGGVPVLLEQIKKLLSKKEN